MKIRYRLKRLYKNNVLYDTLEAYCPSCNMTVEDKAPCRCINCGTKLEPNNDIKRRGAY